MANIIEDVDIRMEGFSPRLKFWKLQNIIKKEGEKMILGKNKWKATGNTILFIGIGTKI